MAFRCLIVGAGLSGSTIARCLVEGNPTAEVKILEQRQHVAGNCYDPVDYVTGLRYHLHGPHAFHTNSDKVWAFLSRFTEWTQYEHRALAQVEDVGLVPVPCNFQTLTALVGPNRVGPLLDRLSEIYKPDEAVPVHDLLASSDPLVQEAGQLAFDTLFVGYTAKQWGCDPSKVAPSVMARVPVRMGWDDRYFADKYQALPTPGYLEMVSAMLDHPAIEVRLGKRAEIDDLLGYDRVIFTGPVDELLNYELGALPYRSLRFEFETHDVDKLYPVAQINFPGSEPWTRITEFKHYGNQVAHGTIIGREFPQEHLVGETDPYYPIPSEATRRLHTAYEQSLSRSIPNVRLAGRLGTYRYFNMDQAVANGLQVAAETLRDARLPD